MHALPMTIHLFPAAVVQGSISHYRDPCVAPGTPCTEYYECCDGSCVEGTCGELQNAE